MKSMPKFGVELHQGKLEGGSGIFLFKRAGMPIYIRALFFAGSRFDSIPGTAHFLEHMLVAGTRRFPTKNKIADYIQAVGGEFGARTSNTLTSINVEIPEAADIEAGIDVIRECLTQSLLDPDTIEKERGSILSELNAKETNPNEYIRDVFSQVAFQGTNLAHGTLGSEEDVKSITKDVLANHLEQFINSGQMCFVISGDVDMSTITSSLNTIGLPVRPRFTLPNKLSIKNEVMNKTKLYPGVKQLQVMYGCRTSVESYKELCALKLLNQVLAGGRGSRLITKLRYESGLVYSISGQVLESVDWGLLRIKFSCNRENLDNAISMINKEFGNLVSQNVTDDELTNTKSKVSKGMVRNMQTSESWVDFHETPALFYPDELRTVEDYITTIESLTKEDILMVIKKYLDSNNFYTAICGDYRAP